MIFAFISIFAFSITAFEVVCIAKAYREGNIGNFIFNVVFSGVNFYFGLKYFFKSIGWL